MRYTSHRTTPREHPSISPAELCHIEEGRGALEPAPATRELLTLRPTWGLMLCRFWVGPVVQFCIYGMPNYLRDVRHLSVPNASYLSAMSLVFGDIGSVAGGAVANMFAWVSGVFPYAAVARVPGLTGVASGLRGIFFPW